MRSRGYRTISIANFEVVQTTGATEGPRSPGAPVTKAGSDFTAATRTSVALNGFVQTSNGTGPLATEWKMYSGPGITQFSDATRTNTTVSFDLAGEYVLMLKGADGIHTPSYDTLR